MLFILVEKFQIFGMPSMTREAITEKTKNWKNLSSFSSLGFVFSYLTIFHGKIIHIICIEMWSTRVVKILKSKSLSKFLHIPKIHMCTVSDWMPCVSEVECQLVTECRRKVSTIYRSELTIGSWRHAQSMHAVH